VLPFELRSVRRPNSIPTENTQANGTIYYKTEEFVGDSSGIVAAQKALTSRFVSKTALIMLPPGAPDGMDFFDDFRLGQGLQPTAQARPTDSCQNAVTGLLKGFRRSAPWHRLFHRV
jgi:hypothetical protein